VLPLWCGPSRQSLLPGVSLKECLWPFPGVPQKLPLSLFHRAMASGLFA